MPCGLLQGILHLPVMPELKLTEGVVQASRAGSSQQGQQEEGSPREGQQGRAQPDLQEIAAAYAQLCAFLKQQKQPSPAPA